MREIKFRAWDEEENKMIEWDDTFFSDMSPVTRWSSYFSFIEMHLMQFTGLYDKEGNEIYIGDVIAIEVETTEGFYRTDQYEVAINDFMQIPVIDSHRGQDKLYKVHNLCKVVGNIYEMPDWDF